jgi:hypothetical protein
MELLLNLSWLFIAVTAVMLLRGNWRRRKWPPLREWIALTTFLFLLFPVISLTDDLHPEIALSEAATGKKHFRILRAHGPDSQPQTPRLPGVQAIVIQSRIDLTPAASFAAPAKWDAPKSFSAASEVTCGRSPPMIILL